MKTFLTILAVVLLAGWIALVMSLATPPREYVWTVQPGTAPLSEGVGEGSDNP